MSINTGLRQASIEEILLREPVDRLAAIVTSQRNTAMFQGMGEKHIKEAISRLQKNRERLKAEMGIKTRTQHKNLIHRYIKHGGRSWQSKNKGVSKNVHEYVETGQAIFRLIQILADVNAARKSIHSNRASN